jgi:hypothetical protein
LNALLPLHNINSSSSSSRREAGQAEHAAIYALV